MCTISDADVADKSHADIITKLLAIVQSGWLIVDSITRKARGLSISQLELATMGFIVCALAMYGFWWHKPFNVERRHVVVKLACPEEQRSDARARADSEPEPVCSLGGRVTDLSEEEFLSLIVKFEDGDFGDRFHPTAKSIAPFLPSAAMYATGAFFSAVHLAAWNWRFPSPLARTLWRSAATAALVTSFSPFWMYPLFFLTEAFQERAITLGEKIVEVVAISMAVLLPSVYVISRITILVLTFYCFAAMPESAYERVQWTAFIPHFGS